MDERTISTAARNASQYACGLLGKVGLCDPSPVPTAGTEVLPALPPAPSWLPGTIKSPEQIATELAENRARVESIQTALAEVSDAGGLFTQASAEVGRLWSSIKDTVAGYSGEASATVGGAVRALTEGASSAASSVGEVAQRAETSLRWLALGVAAVAVLVAIRR